MRQSQLFTKTSKTAPKDEVSKNATLLIRAGFIDKLHAGVYTFLPLGLRVMNRIEQIIREEMDKADGQEIYMPALHPKENWETTGRWSGPDPLFKLKDASDREFVLGATHEEVVVPLLKRFISSYKDLPQSVYQFQNKFRAELRAKSGLLRGKEFIMKDMYSFHADEADLAKYYEKMKGVYAKVYERLGLGKDTYITFASGGSFSKYSHEFQTVLETGEDTISICEKCHVAINKEIIAEQSVCPSCGSKDLIVKSAVEVGNIFELKTKYTTPFELTYRTSEGKDELVVMGCYGIGLSRLMGVIVEYFADEKGLVWPEAVSPFIIHLVSLGDVSSDADKLYERLTAKGIEVLYDDRDKPAGEKFADSDLIGIQHRVIISAKTVASGKLEYKARKDTDAIGLTEDELMAKLIGYEK
ncbi:MAG: aminoacyl--tRNA ligase-related protein [Candidatus Paceibacterota bacterium]|jgi:prolyl-tRNA synthetase